jgi:hypothetical protein
MGACLGFLLVVVVLVIILVVFRRYVGVYVEASNLYHVTLYGYLKSLWSFENFVDVVDGVDLFSKATCISVI